jgi:membrane-bound lytic murein transglycosylase D
MAMAESSFKNRAYSRARAVGIWQFMPKTATRFGLDVDLYIDERRDPIKSTEAAIEYLNFLYGNFGKWYLAVMAYNCGEGRLKKAIQQAGSDDLTTLLQVEDGKRRQYLPKETRTYIRKIIAMASIAQSENLMMSTDNMHLLNRGQSYPMASIEVGPGTHLKEIGESIGVSYQEMQVLNASLNYGFVPPYAQKFEVHIPYEKVAAFKENYKRRNPDEKYVVYRVKGGDTLSSIGRKFGINFNIIKDFNRLRGSFLSLNQKLIIPIEKAQQVEYVVQNGDTLTSIARKFNIELERLIDINNKKKIIYVGEKLIIKK